MLYTWIIEGKLAQSALPSKKDIQRLAEVFSGIVVLLSHREIPINYISDLQTFGLNVLHLPTMDHHPVELLDLLRAIYFIKRHHEKGKSVLVHCYGGIGRSGLVTASYLIYNGFNIYESIRHVRSRIPGSIENQWQLQMLEDLYLLLSNISREILERYMEVINDLYFLDTVSYYHLSKVLQFTLSVLNRVTGIKLDHDYLNEIYIAMTHAHRENILDMLRKVVLHSDEIRKSVLIELAHLLDHKYDSRVVSLLTESELDKVSIKLLCLGRCEDIVDEIKKEIHRFQEAFNNKVVFTWDYYYNYI
ncbi:MAG: dual specificity protein phosphatase family protein [Desulfurococcaceae archaeon]